MKTSTIKTNATPNAPVGKAWDEVSASFDRFCLAAGIETLGAMMEADAEEACGPRHSRSDALPEVPILGKFVPGHEASSWQGIGAPRNTPAEIADKLGKEINMALADPMQARLGSWLPRLH